jgi:hypothetical protein
VKRPPYLIVFAASYLIFLSGVTHKEPKFLLPVFPVFFLFIGLSLSKLFKSRPLLVKLLIIFGVLLECGINIYFVKFHEIGAWNALREANTLNYDSLVTNNKFEGNYWTLTHRKEKSLPTTLFVTHDPPFVKYSDPKIPLIQAIEHPLIEAVEFLSLIENYS